ncbi:polysaccharide biosynthesis protein [Proteocatella sphenisci]|uniref:polysaccharide biosynthesis protein n=1 Tax=Proteocatella sphenisci TaxID=181070 RepID=UPI0004901DD9|nr:nucleoside-diphosphate sugar epimerase/dehydratase [Proteocatella sphenisci]
MKNKIFNRRNTLMLIDVLLAVIGYFAAFLITLSADQVASYTYTFKQSFFILAVIYSATFYFTHIYEQMWRYADASEYQKCAISSMVAGAIFVVAGEIAGYNVPIRIQIVAPVIIMGLVIASRIIYKIVIQKERRKAHQNHVEISRNKTDINKENKNNRLAIVGAGDAGVQLLREIRNNRSLRYDPVCFVDDNPQKIGRTIYGVDIRGPVADIEHIVETSAIETIIIAVPSMNSSDKKRIVEQCSNTSCKIKILPGIPVMLAAEDYERNIELIGRLRNIDIEDLLARDSIKVSEVDIASYISGKNILVTGGGGSIGSEICRQVVTFGANRLVIVDNYENNAYEIEQELKRDYGFTPQVEIITVREYDSLDKFFCNFIDKYGKIDVVFHAAAHKHVPLMEHNPDQAVANNVSGTYNVAKLCNKYKVDKMILVSTDKAVNPTNVMGATKRVCEMVVQAMNDISDHTVYSAVRFGNVLGSNGSVIPLFRKQIEKGGPVTVTHPDIIRYFMTIPEAVSLVLNAGGMAKGGEIFVLDMGEPVKIVDLAKNIIRLSGLMLGRDIDIEFTGLRPGEKLYEELLMSEEGLSLTSSEKIFIGKPGTIDKEQLFDWIDNMEKNRYSYSSSNIIEQLRLLVDTFKPSE